MEQYFLADTWPLYRPLRAPNGVEKRMHGRNLTNSIEMAMQVEHIVHTNLYCYNSHSQSSLRT
jgi:hypothetical protein